MLTKQQLNNNSNSQQTNVGFGYVSDIMNDTDIIFDNIFSFSRIASKVILNLTRFPCNVSTSLNNYICKDNKDPEYGKICVVSNRVTNQICNANSMGIIQNTNILRKIKNTPSLNFGDTFNQLKNFFKPITQYESKCCGF